MRSKRTVGLLEEKFQPGKIYGVVPGKKYAKTKTNTVFKKLVQSPQFAPGFWGVIICSHGLFLKALHSR